MRRVYVQHTYGFDVAAFDQDADFAELGRIALGDQWKPDSVALSRDGKLLYTNWSHLGWTKADHRGGSHSLFTAHDAETLAEVWRLELDSAIQHFAYDPTGRYFYNAVMDRARCIRVDVETQSADYIQLPVLGGHKVRVSADGRYCYVGSMTSHELLEIDCATLSFTRRLEFPSFVRPFVLTPDSRTAFVQVSSYHGFYEVDLGAWKIVRQVDLPPLPADTPVEDEWPFTVDHGLEISKDGKYLCALATTGNYMMVYDLPSLDVRCRVELGVEPSYLAFSPEGDELFVTNRVKGGVIVLSVPDFRIIGQRAETGRRPQRICMSRRT